MAQEFKLPEFMKNESVDDIMTRMLKVLPETISKEENGWVSDLFLPAAIEHSRAVEFVLSEALKNIVPRYSYGDMLLYHAETRGIKRRSASPARAVLTIEGEEGTVIPKGFMFCTVSTQEKSGIVFKAENECTIPESGEILIETTAAEGGSKTNVAAQTIILMVKPVNGIKSIVNKEPAYDGFDEESEEDLRQRIIEYDLMQGVSFIGSTADYRRWAMEVEGVGDAKIISASDDTGTVKIILVDMDLKPVSEGLCDDVYNHIMRPDSPYERLAPINAVLNVISAKPVNIFVKANIILEDGYTADMVKGLFFESLKNYILSDGAKNEIKYAEIGAALINTQGIADYKNLTLNGAEDNIIIGSEYVAVVSEEGIEFE